MDSIRVKRGLSKDLPTNLPLGELAFCTDTQELWVGTGSSTPLKKVKDSELEKNLEQTNAQLSDVKKNVASYINVMSLGCDNTGMSDNSTILNEFIQSSNHNAINLYFPEGDYLIDSPLLFNVNKNVNLKGENKLTTLVSHSQNAIIKCYDSTVYVTSIAFKVTSNLRNEFTMYAISCKELWVDKCYFTSSGGQESGLHIENVVTSHVDRCIFTHSNISLKTWDCKITNTWVWALWRPYGIGIHGGCGNITISNVDVVPPFRTPSGDLNSSTFISGIKAGIWINSEGGNPTNNVIMENVYFDGNPTLNTGVGLACENVFGITLSSFRANKMNDYPIVIKGCYNVIISKGVFYENNKLDLNSKNEILVKNPNGAKCENIVISDNHFINYKQGYVNPAPAIRIDDDVKTPPIVKYNQICQQFNNGAYGATEIYGKNIHDLYTNSLTKLKTRITGKFTLGPNNTGTTVVYPNAMLTTPNQGNFRFWVLNGITPRLRVQPISSNQAYIATNEALTQSIEIYYEIKL